MSMILINGGAVVTLDPQRHVLEPGYIFIEDDRITAVGAGAAPDELVRRAGEIIDATGKAVMPGMVNAHLHTFQSFVRGVADDRPLMSWLIEVCRPVGGAMTAGDIRLAAQVALVENLHGGATSVIDHAYTHSAPDNEDTVLRVAQELGIRYLLARGCADVNVTPASQETPERMVSELARLWATWQSAAGGRIRVEFGPTAVWSCTEGALRRIRDVASRLGAGIHIHVGETEGELNDWLRQTGQRPVAWLARLGLLGPRTQLAHGIWFSDDDIRLVADSGATVVYCPASNAYLASGVCRVQDLRRAGVPVALGTDGQTCNNGIEMIDLLKLGANLLKVHTLDARAVQAEDMLEMACRGGAIAFGQPESLGSLEVGKKADLVVIDLGNLRLSTARRIPYALVYFAEKHDVDTVIVDGKVLLRDGRVTVLDEDALLQEARAAWLATIERVGLPQ